MMVKPTRHSIRRTAHIKTKGGALMIRRWIANKQNRGNNTARIWQAAKRSSRSAWGATQKATYKTWRKHTRRPTPWTILGKQPFKKGGKKYYR